MTKTKAQRIVERIEANVDAFYADARTYEEFSAIQRRLWDEAASAGIDAEVNSIIAKAEGR